MKYKVKKNFVVALSLYWVLIFSFGDSDDKIQVNVIPDHSIVMQNSGIHLQFAKNMRVTIYYLKGDQQLSLNKYRKIEEEPLPSFYSIANGHVYNSFIFDLENIKI